MALQVAGMEKINSMIFSGHRFNAWIFVGHRFTVPSFSGFERSSKVFELQQRAGSPRS
jgi:hypothetical protein